jgi:hypothetical protein
MCGERLNRIGERKSIRDWLRITCFSARFTAEYLVEIFFDQQICSPLRDRKRRMNQPVRSLPEPQGAQMRNVPASRQGA